MRNSYFIFSLRENNLSPSPHALDLCSARARVWYFWSQQSQADPTEFISYVNINKRWPRISNVNICSKKILDEIELFHFDVPSVQLPTRQCPTSVHSPLYTHKTENTVYCTTLGLLFNNNSYCVCKKRCVHTTQYTHNTHLGGMKAQSVCRLSGKRNELIKWNVDDYFAGDRVISHA